MGWFFRKSWNIGKLFRINLSRRGIGYSVGIPGFRIGKGPRGTYVSGGIPGTGIGYREYLGKHDTGREDEASVTPDFQPIPPPLPTTTIQVPLNRVRHGDAVFWLETVAFSPQACTARLSVSNAYGTRPILIPAMPASDPRTGYAIVVDSTGQMYRCIGSEGIGGPLPPGVTRTGDLHFEPLNSGRYTYAAVRIGNIQSCRGVPKSFDLPFALTAEH